MNDNDETALAVYGVVAARRAQWDNLVWQVPVLSLTAQAFLFSIALAGDSSPLARYLSAGLSLVVTFLCVTLMARHRQAELTDAHWLEAAEQTLPVAFHQHGEAWRARRNSEKPDAGFIDRLVPLVPGYITWVLGLSLFGLAAVGIIIVTVFWPNLL